MVLQCPELKLDEREIDMTRVEEQDAKLMDHFKDALIVDQALTRQLVSFQANKKRSSYRWYKYKEAFSATLVEYLLRTYASSAQKILDPFAGSGTALFAASEMGIDADGIELLPIGQKIMEARLCLQGFSENDFADLRRWISEKPWLVSDNRSPLNELRITQGAYPKETENLMERYLGASKKENPRVCSILHFALLCVLESISFTRKDGQYLRWDYRSQRRQGTRPFDKGVILDFNQAIHSKLNEILVDTTGEELFSLLPVDAPTGAINILAGSSLELMPRLMNGSYDAIITSPPYCNRYDYTRTYALELASLGINEDGIRQLRQDMLSCTVENRAKDLLAINPQWEKPISVADNQALLQAVLLYLENQNKNGNLNNHGIPRMVRGYFYEMSCIIFECARVLKHNGVMLMVNDNVRYAGIAISVDAILSNMAENLGFQVQRIHVLPTGKGNSSQQMGEHGRLPLRKCIYAWRRIKNA